MLRSRLMAHICLSPRLQFGPPISQIKSLTLRDVTGPAEDRLCRSECSGSFMTLLLRYSRRQSLRCSQLAWCLGLQLSYPPQAEHSLSFMAVTCHAPQASLSLWGPPQALRLLHAPSPALCTSQAEKCPIRRKLRRSLSWSPPHLISHWVPFVWKMGSGAAIWAVSLIGRLGKTWCPGRRRRVDWSSSPF